MMLRNRFVWVTVILLATTAAVIASVLSSRSARSSGSEATQPQPASLQEHITTEVRATLEQQDPHQHHHAGHSAAPETAAAPLICGVHVYGYEPAGVTALADVQTVYAFHFCGVAESQRPWDVAVKLAGPVIVDLSTEPAGIRVVEATPEVKYVDRLRQMFPAKYAELALKQALTDSEMSQVRRRYNEAAGL